MTTLRGTIFDRIEVWGQPWHGLMDQAGVLDLGGGKTKTSSYIPNGGQAQLVQFDGLPVPVDRACDIAEGASWKNWAILAGNSRQYLPLIDYKFGANTWLYRTADGTVWCLRLYCSGINDPVVIQARNVNKNGDMFQTVYTGLDDYKSVIRQITNSQITALSASKTGATAIVNLRQIYTASISITSNPNWIDTYAINFQPTSAKFAEINVSGGDSTNPPTVSVSLLSSADEFSRQSYSAHSNATVRDHAKWMVGAWMRPDGTVARTYLDVDITRTLSGNGTWSALTGVNVVGKLFMPSGEVQILTLSSNATVSGSGGYLSTTTTSTPPGTTTNTQAQFGISHASSLDGAVQKFEVNGVFRVIGGLGQQINSVTLQEYQSGEWCQHPITGEITLAGHFF